MDSASKIPPDPAPREAARPARQAKKTSWAAAVAGGAFGLAGAMAPGLTARLARRLMFRPRRLPASEPGRSILATARIEPLQVDGQTMYSYSWGGPGPGVLLVHGWGGDAAQMTGFVEPLRQAGHRVVAIDMVAHGRSSGRQASVRHFEACIASAARAHGPFHGVVAHSMGAAAVTFALSRGLQARRAVFLGPVSRYDSVWEYSRRMMNLPPQVMPRIARHAERWLGVTFAEMEPARLAPSMSIPLLVVHDRGDRESPYEDGALLAAGWPGAELLPTEKMGHTRALRDPDILRRAAVFVSGGQGGASS